MGEAVSGPTREEVLQWVREVGLRNVTYDSGPYEVTKPTHALERFAALAFAAGSRSGEDARDAARYRWLRSVPNGHEAMRIVNDKPEGIDAAIDAAMGGPDA